jgi:hypothetical protein
MFDRDQAIDRWRVALARTDQLDVDAIAELEIHLIDSMEDLAKTPLTEEERFLVAAHRLGQPAELGPEFERQTPWATWRTPILWATIGVAWTLGVEAIFEMAVPLGVIVGAKLGLTLAWVKAWAALVYVGGPIVTFASVALWMQRYSARHPSSGRAVLATAIIAALIRGLSVPFLSDVLQPAAQALMRARSWWGVYGVVETAALMGFAIVALVGAFAIARLRGRRGAPLLSV